MRSYSEKNIKSYDKKADNYENTLDGKLTEKFKKLLIAAVDINDGCSVLDIGCGNGTLLSRMAKLKQIHGFGVDISSQMIKTASAHYPHLKFATSSCEKLPFDDNSMDIITVCAAYHHFPDVDVFAAEAGRLLKDKGNLYIAEVYFPFVLRHIANIFLPLSRAGDVKFYSPGEIESTFSNVGFHLVKAQINGHIQVIHLQKA